MNNKMLCSRKMGFTLIELLAVIMILALIAIITVPVIFNTVEGSHEDIIKDSAYGYIREVEIANISLMTSGDNLDGIIDVSRLNDIVDITGDKPDEGYVELYEDEIISYSLKFGDYVVTKDRDTGEVTAIKNGLIMVGSIDYTNSCNNPNYNPTDKSLFTYSDNGDNTITITGYNGDIKDIRIPCKIDGKDVLQISDNAFKRKKLTSVVIPNSVISIGYLAFETNQLTSVVIPNSVTSIGESVFANNQLTSLVIPESVTIIGCSAFADNQLTSVEMPNSVISIEDLAFSGNELTNIVIPNSVTSIGYAAFKNNQLTSVVIPNSVTSIGMDAFGKSSLSNKNLTTIYNNTGRSFNWMSITNGSSTATFVTGTVPHSYGNITVTTSN